MTIPENSCPKVTGGFDGNSPAKRCRSVPQIPAASTLISTSPGWGTGWATGNLLRFNTVAAGDKVWVLRCVQPGAATLADDRIRLQARYDRD